MRKRLKDAGVAVDTSKLFLEDVEGGDSENHDETTTKAATIQATAL